MGEADMRKLVLLLAMVLCAPSNAEARHWRYYGYYNRDSDQNVQDDRSRSREWRAPEAGAYGGRGGGFGPTLEQLIRGCNQDAIDLQRWPLDSVARVVVPTEEQRDALEQVQRA